MGTNNQRFSAMRWGLIGASTIAAEWMIDAIRANGGHIMGVASGSAEHGKAYAEKHDIPESFTSVDALLDLGLDAVYISSVNNKHKAQLEAAAARGCHIYCEKPLTLTLKEALSMIDTCKGFNVQFATNHHLRWAASHQAIRQAIADGVIGEVRSARVFHAVYLPPHLQGWRVDNPGAGGGVVLDITVHNCDILAFLLGEYPTTVTSMTDIKALGQGLEDEAMSVWRYPSGVLAYTHESFVTPDAGNGIEIHGSAGSLIGENVMTQQPIGTVYLQRDGARTELTVSPQGLYTAAVADFVSAINEVRAPACDGVAGTKSLAVALAVLDSAQRGQHVKVNYGGL